MPGAATAFVAETLPLPRTSTASTAETLPLHCGAAGDSGDAKRAGGAGRARQEGAITALSEGPQCCYRWVLRFALVPLGYCGVIADRGSFRWFAKGLLDSLPGVAMRQFVLQVIGLLQRPRNPASTVRPRFFFLVCLSCVLTLSGAGARGIPCCPGAAPKR